MRRKGLLAALAAIVLLLPILHYALPQVDVVRAVGGEVRRVDTATGESGAPVTRDVYLVQAETLSGEPSVYRNEDALIYGKFDSADLQAQVLSLAADQQTMAVRHYGWRIRLFSMFPNALAVWPVDEDYRHIPVFNTIVLLLLLSGLAFAFLRFRGVARRRAERRDRAEQEALERERERRARIEAERSSERRDVDDFLSGPGSGPGSGGA